MSHALAEAFVDLFNAVLDLSLAHIDRELPRDYRVTLTDVATQLFVEDFCVDPEPDPKHEIIHARWRDNCNRVTRNHPKAKAWTETLVEALTYLIIELPRHPSGQFSCTTTPTQKMLSGLTSTFIVDKNPDFFPDLKKRLMRNLDKDDPPLRILDGTPLKQLFPITTTFGIPTKAFSEHGFLFAKSGHGKSQTMRSIFASLLKEDCALFLLDGNGALIENLDQIATIKDRLVVLDPEETPALNFFSMTGASREKQMELFFYLFKAIDQGLTERQATMVSYLVELMQVIPEANLDTLRHVCEHGSAPYAHLFNKLSPVAQDFFTYQFGKRDVFIGQTRQQIAQRLYTVARNRMFSDMFNATENKFDAFRLMQEKKIVIINTSRDKLGDLGSAIFGRYILAQCLAAAWQRPKDQRHLALIMVDEAKTYLDDQSKKILSDARAFGLGIFLASQFPDQLDEGVRKEVINNTTVKLAGPAAYSVVAGLNRDMRCDVDFILNMKKKDYSHAEWACYVDNLTPQAFKISVPFGAVEKLLETDRMDTTTYQDFRRANKQRYAATPTTQKPPEKVALTLPPNEVHAASKEGRVPPIVPPATLSPKKEKLNKPEPKKTRKKKLTPKSSPTDYDTDH